MNYKKFRLVPEDRLKAPESFEDSSDLLKRAVTLTLKLCRVQAFNDKFEIKGHEGKYLENTNVVDFLLDALKISIAPQGRKEFVKLLFEANVDPNLLLNTELKQELESLYKTAQSTPNVKPNPESNKEDTQELESTDDFVGYHTVFTQPKPETESRRRRKRSASRTTRKRRKKWIRM